MWNWLRRRTTYEPPTDEALRALERSERDHADAVGRWPLIAIITARSGQLRQENHFAERVEAAFRMGR